MYFVTEMMRLLHKYLHIVNNVISTCLINNITTSDLILLVWIWIILKAFGSSDLGMYFTNDAWR